MIRRITVVVVLGITAFGAFLSESKADGPVTVRACKIEESAIKFPGAVGGQGNITVCSPSNFVKVYSAKDVDGLHKVVEAKLIAELGTRMSNELSATEKRLVAQIKAELKKEILQEICQVLPQDQRNKICPR